MHGGHAHSRPLPESKNGEVPIADEHHGNSGEQDDYDLGIRDPFFPAEGAEVDRGVVAIGPSDVPNRRQSQDDAQEPGHHTATDRPRRREEAAVQVGVANVQVTVQGDAHQRCDRHLESRVTVMHSDLAAHKDTHREFDTTVASVLHPAAF